MAFLDVNLDILSEILSRTDLKTMRKCRILSKECNALTYEPGFLESHKEKTKTICGFLIQSLHMGEFYSTFLDIDNPSDDKLKLSFDFLPTRQWILATVDMGLVFCRSQYPGDHHYICKPTSRQWEIIPNPKYFAKKIAMIVLTSNPLWFKIVRLSNNVDDMSYIHWSLHCEIFDSSVWAWKQSDDLILCYDEYFYSKDGITAGGKLHWVTRNRNEHNRNRDNRSRHNRNKHNRNKHKVLVISFDPYKESWESTSVPASCNDDNRSICLTVYEGKLAILSIDIKSVEVWIMKNCHGEKYWDKKYTIDLERLKNEIGRPKPVSLYNTDTLLMLDDFTATFYNFKNHQHHQLSLNIRCNSAAAVYFVQTDSEPIQIRNKKE